MPMFLFQKLKEVKFNNNFKFFSRKKKKLSSQFSQTPILMSLHFFPVVYTLQKFARVFISIIYNIQKNHFRLKTITMKYFKMKIREGRDLNVLLHFHQYYTNNHLRWPRSVAPFYGRKLVGRVCLKSFLLIISLMTKSTEIQRKNKYIGLWSK